MKVKKGHEDRAPFYFSQARRTSDSELSPARRQAAKIRKRNIGPNRRFPKLATLRRGRKRVFQIANALPLAVAAILCLTAHGDLAY